jgi:flagellar basal-body rod protein FlgF
MDNAIYITLTRQLALFRDMEVTASNIANANTTGFNSEHLLFTRYLNKDVNQKVRNPMEFTYDIATYRNTSTGSIKATGNPLDLAIQGNGYFVVETPLGTRYTKAGNFQLNDEGTLVTKEGYPILSDSGVQITFPPETKEITIGQKGNIKADDAEFLSIGIVEFANEQVLERLNGGLFKTDVRPEQAATATLLQGALESSNVTPVSELTHVMEVSRATTNTAKLIETIYDLQRKANNAWAKQA